jgi:hypothetical protein
MRWVLYVVSALSALDAATTYIIITAGLGMEANPLLQFFNDVPEAVFIVQLLNTLMVASSIKLFGIFADRLPPALKARIYKAFYVAFTVAMAWRAAVVVNNTLGIVWGITPLADLFSF